MVETVAQISCCILRPLLGELVVCGGGPPSLGSTHPYACTFPCHSPLPSPRLPATVWPWLPALPAPDTQRAMVFQAVTAWGVSTPPHRGHPRSEAGAGKAAVVGLDTGVKPAAPSSSHGNAEILHCWVSPQLDGPLLRADVVFTGLQSSPSVLLVRM